MWRTIVICGLFAVLIPVIVTRPMYTLVHERAELLEYNSSLVAGPPIFDFKKINRTSFAFNVSFTSLVDIVDRKVMATIYVDKMYGTQYKRTGTKLTVNVCKFWQKNTFGIREQLNRNGHMEACDVVRGTYYTINFIPDENMFPRFLPFGSYRIEINIYHEDGAKFFKMYWFAKVNQLVE